MARQSLEKAVLIMNGHRVQGFSSDGDGIEMPQVDMVSVKMSADGIKLFANTGEKGGEVTVRLQGNSPSIAFFAQQRVAALKGADVEWNATLSIDGVTVRMIRGAMITAPAGPSLSSDGPVDREFVWNFEQILEDYSGHNFPTVPVA